MKIRYIYLLAIFLIKALIPNELNAQNILIENGFLDVTQTELKGKTIKLKGNCDFYWKEFLMPKSPLDSLDGHVKYTAQLPKSWTKIALSDTNNCTSNGYATYRMRIKIANKDEIYGLKVNTVFSSYKLFVNGRLLSSAGVVGKNREQSYPQFKSKEIPITVIKKDNTDYQILDIVFHVSNYHHLRAGLQRTILFGTMNEIIRSTKNALIIHLMLIGIILIIGFNHVLMYLLRRLNIANLLFGALSMVMILRDISTEERIILHFFPDMDWEWLVRLDNFSGFGTMTFFALYFYFTFRRDFPKVMFYILLGYGFLTTVLVFATNQLVYGQFRIFMEAYVGLGGLYYAFGILLPAAIKKRTGAFYTFIGMFLLYITAINDVLYSMGILTTMYIAPYGIAVFMFLQSFLLTKKSAIAQKQNEKLSIDLRQEKLNLEERIEERTQKLTNQANELKKYREVQEEQNLINEGLNKITEVMRKNKDDLNTLAYQLLGTLIKRIDASMGALYLHTIIDNEGKLKLIADIGLNLEAKTNIMDTKEGLTGMCFSTGKAEYYENISKKYFSITSGLGGSTPKILALIPMKIDEQVIGVVEIASFKPISDVHKAFILRAVENISAQINIVKMSDESHSMISEYKKLEQEANAKNQEMMENLEELKAVQEEAENKEGKIHSLLSESEKRETEVKIQLEESYNRQALFQEQLNDAYEKIEKLESQEKNQ